MSAQLVHLLGYLDREGVTELVLSSGRPVAVRVAGTYKPVTQHGVTTQQLVGLLDGTTLIDSLPVNESEVAPIDADIGGRSVRVMMMRRGDELLVRFEPRERGPGATRPVAAPAISAPIPRAATPQPQPRPSPVPSAPTPQPSPAASVRGAPTQHPAARPSQVAHKPTPTAYVAPSAPPDPALIAAVTAGVARVLVDERIEVTPALAALIHIARQRAASDLHISANRPVQLRLIGELSSLEPTPLAAADVDAMLLPLLGPMRRAALEARGYVDLAVEIPGAGRLRANVSRIQGGLKGAFRLALPVPPKLDELGLPRELAKVVAHHQGLVVVAGPSGHGKTTTLAALVDLINEAHPYHILTIEDPVEIEHPRKAAVVSQREVGRNTLNFAAALKASLREDPDVIVIGELRDRETVEIALTAAETGHLVMSTMSTPSAAKTIDRLIDMFPPDDQSQVRASLAGALRAIVAQRLIPAAAGGAMVPAVELLTGVLPLAAMIRDNKLFQLPNLMQRGRSFGMIRLDDSLAELVRSGRVTIEAALKVADSKRDLSAALGLPPPAGTTGVPAPPGGAAAGNAPRATPQPGAPPGKGGLLGGLFGKKDRE